MKVRANGIELYCEVRGHGDPVVLSHGWMCDHTVWESQVGLLSQHHTVITYDHRGHGASEKPERGYAVQTLADDLSSLLQQLGLSRTSIVGHSMGGMASLLLAAERPEQVSKLVLIDTTAKNDPAIYVKLGIESVLRSDDSLANWMVELAHSDPSPQVRRDTLAMASRVPRPIAKECLTEFMTHYDARKRLACITASTMIIVGEKDKMTPVRMARALNKGIAGSRLEIVPGSKHMPMTDDAEALNRILVEFLG